jgi:hypothetical protein
MTAEPKKPKEEEQPLKNLPEIRLVLVKTGQKITLENLDKFSPEQIKNRYRELVEQFGANNVRLCNVVNTIVKTEIDFEM